MLPRLLLVAVWDIEQGQEILQDYDNGALLDNEYDMFESIEDGGGGAGVHGLGVGARRHAGLHKPF